MRARGGVASRAEGSARLRDMEAQRPRLRLPRHDRNPPSRSRAHAPGGCRDMGGMQLALAARSGVPAPGARGALRLLEEAGVEVVLAPPAEGGNLDDVYAFDPALVTEQGVILLRPGKECRRGEPAALERDLADAGIPVVGRLEAPAEAEGGDLIRLDDGRFSPATPTARTRPASKRCAEPYPRCAASTSRICTAAARSSICSRCSAHSTETWPSPILPLLPARLVELLEERDVRLVEVPDAGVRNDGAERPRARATPRVDARRERGDAPAGWRPPA